MSLARFHWKQSSFQGDPSEEVVDVETDHVAISDGHHRREIKFEYVRSVHLHESGSRDVLPFSAAYLVERNGNVTSFGVVPGSVDAYAEFCRAVSELLVAFDATRPGVYVELGKPLKTRMQSVAVYAALAVGTIAWSIISFWPLEAPEYFALALCAVVGGVFGIRLYGPRFSRPRVLASQLAKELAERLAPPNQASSDSE